jgi:hypothetical protein
MVHLLNGGQENSSKQQKNQQKLYTNENITSQARTTLLKILIMNTKRISWAQLLSQKSFKISFPNTNI